MDHFSYTSTAFTEQLAEEIGMHELTEQELKQIIGGQGYTQNYHRNHSYQRRSWNYRRNSHYPHYSRGWHR